MMSWGLKSSLGKDSFVENDLDIFAYMEKQ